MTRPFFICGWFYIDVRSLMESHHSLIAPEGKLCASSSQLSKSPDSDWWMYLPARVRSHGGVKLTVKRGVSFLMSSRDTSIPITPRINWFWCWERKYERKGMRNKYLFIGSFHCWLLSSRAPAFIYCTSPFLSSLVFVLLKTGSVPVMTRPSSWWRVKQTHYSTQEYYRIKV